MAGGKIFFFQSQKISVATTTGESLAAGWYDFWRMFFHFGKQCRGFEHEHAAVPEVVAGFNVFFGCFEAFFDGSMKGLQTHYLHGSMAPENLELTQYSNYLHLTIQLFSDIYPFFHFSGPPLPLY